MQGQESVKKRKKEALNKDNRKIQSTHNTYMHDAIQKYGTNIKSVPSMSAIHHLKRKQQA